MQPAPQVIELNGETYVRSEPPPTGAMVIERDIRPANLAEALRVLRAIKNKTLNEAALESKVNRNTLSWLESGEQKEMSAQVRSKLQNYYRVRFLIQD